jgi:hypothetical protein
VLDDPVVSGGLSVFNFGVFPIFESVFHIGLGVGIGLPWI